MMQDMSTLTNECVEQQILQLLAPDVILSLNEITTSIAGTTDTERVRQILIGLRRQNLVTRRAYRRGVWYMGYALGQDRVRPQPDLDEIPQPFRAFLSHLTW